MKSHKLTYMSDIEWENELEESYSHWDELSDLIIPGVHVKVEWPESQKLDGAVGLGTHFWVVDGDTPSYVCDAEWYNSIVQ